MVVLKKKLLLTVLLLCTLCACRGNAPADNETVRAYWNELPGFTAHVKILSDLGQSLLEYEVDYVYNKEGNDTFVLTAPESIAGISGAIAGEGSGEFSLQYDDTVLDDAMPQRTGLTPADGLFCLLGDLRNDVPAQQWTEQVAGQEVLVLRFESEDGTGSIAKQLWLTADGKQPVCAELYDGEKCVLTLQFMSYQTTTSIGDEKSDGTN